MAIIDVITYNGEKELFDLRYNILKDDADEFIVVEFNKTFSGNEKPFYFEEIKDKYPKVRYFPIKDNVWHKYMDLAISSPNTIGADHWKEEFCQKEYIKDCLTHLKDEDIVFIGDCDEIYDCQINPGQVVKLKLRVYTYYINNKSSENFWGTLVGKYKDIKSECLNHIRVTAYKTNTYYGWHFTSMGGYKEVCRKLTDSYTRASYWTPWVEENLKDNIDELKDFLGRGFTYQIDESELPKYLIENKQKYAHLFK